MSEQSKQATHKLPPCITAHFLQWMRPGAITFNSAHWTQAEARTLRDLVVVVWLVEWMVVMAWLVRILYVNVCTLLLYVNYCTLLLRVNA